MAAPTRLLLAARASRGVMGRGPAAPARPPIPSSASAAPAQARCPVTPWACPCLVSCHPWARGVPPVTVPAFTTQHYLPPAPGPVASPPTALGPSPPDVLSPPRPVPAHVPPVPPGCHHPLSPPASSQTGRGSLGERQRALPCGLGCRRCRAVKGGDISGCLRKAPLPADGAAPCSPAGEGPPARPALGGAGAGRGRAL